MKWRTTRWLVAVAVVLFAFIYAFERHVKPTALAPEPPARLLAIRAVEVTNIQLHLANRLVLRAEKAEEGWNLTVPLLYPAQSDRVESLLQALENLTSQKHISLAELTANRQTVADFGLDVPQATLTLQHNGQRIEIMFGNKTPAGDHVYAQLLTAPGIYVINSEAFDRLPRDANDWRDAALLDLKGLVLDRLEVRGPGRGFALVLDPTNKVFTLSKPTPARADGTKVDALLRTIAAGRVVRFETDSPHVELEPYGLQPPQGELVLGQGSNDLVIVQFGKSPTNDPGLVYARRMSQTNIVLVPKTLFEALQTSPSELRDRHLLSFSAAAVETFEVVGPESFSVQRQTNGVWLATGPQSFPADAGLVLDWLDRLSRLEGDVEKDVVTDFASYGLAPPVRQYLLKTSVTNFAGAATNRVIAQLDIGGQQGEKVFARRVDENSVYSLPRASYEGLPSAAWQLRDRRVFNFTTNHVASVTIRHNAYERKLVRSSNGEWSFAAGSQGIINTFAVEEMLFRLGELRATAWVARGDEQRGRYGFTDAGHKLTIELKNGDRPANLTLEFGGRAPASLYPYALVTMDGQAWIFEFPIALFYDMVRYLSNPPLPGSAAGL